MLIKNVVSLLPELTNELNQKIMISVLFADNHPVVHHGFRTFFQNHHEIKVLGQVSTLEKAVESLRTNPAQVLILDLELNGLSSINLIKLILKEFTTTRIVIFSNLSDGIYAPNAIRAGASAYVNKKDTLESLCEVVVRVSKGDIIINEELQKNLSLISKQSKHDRLYRKLSNRETEVLRFLSEGKKNNEIAKILDLNEKTISTYKLRLLTKLNVTNLVDLVNKAKTLEIV